jgi:hypothetical protein
MHAISPDHSFRPTAAWARALIALACAALIAGCAALPGQQPLRVNVVGIEPLPSEGLEVRFALKLRAQNPNETAAEFNGVSVDLEVAGKTLATGVSDQQGTVPRFGETVFSVPMSISALAALRQALGLASGQSIDELPFKLHGRLSSGGFGGYRFSDEGTLRWPDALERK